MIFFEHGRRTHGYFTARKTLLLQTISSLDKAEEIANRYNDEIELGFVSNLRWDTIFSQGRFEEAEALSKKVLEIGKRHHEVELKILSTEQLATLEAMRQHYEEALAWLDLSDPWCQEQNWSRQIAWNSYFRGSILAQHREALAAEPFLTRSQKMARSWGERRLIARNKERLIQVYVDTERL